ncbi:MAG: CpaF family protein [Ktedonobacteraceae bacterium]
MQSDQPGEPALANGPVAHIPRSRPGARATMRVTNRYTMPPLMPRAPQNSSFSWDAQGQGLAASSSHCMEPLSPVEEDAWLNDMPPSYRPNNSPDRVRAEAGMNARTDASAGADASAENRATARVAPTIHTSDAGNPLPGHRLWSVGRRLSERVCQELARRQVVVEGNDAETVEQARECAVDILRAEPALASQVYNLAEAEQVIQVMLDEVAGFGPLAALWREDAVTEIMAVGPRLTIIERDGDMQEAPYHFEDEQHMLRIVGNILRGAERAFDPSIVITNARLPDSTFVNIVMPPAAVKGPTLTLRKRRKDVSTLAELVKLETLSEPMAHFLHMSVEARLNIVICGGLRSGRTTLLNALAACIPDAERIVTLEDVAELQLPQKQIVSLEARLMTSENSERGNSSSMRELLLCALRLRPERIILGDCWNDDAGILLSALHTGYNGSLFAMYANGLQDCLGRLEMMWLASRSATPVSITREQVARAVHLVIHIGRLSNGARKVLNIAQVQGVQGNKIKARSIFYFRENSDGQGIFEAGSSVSACLAELRRSIPPVRA